MNASETSRFLTAAFGESWGPDQLAVCTIKDKRVVAHWADSAERAAAIAAREAERLDVYATCCLRSARAMREGKYGGSTDVVVMPGLWLDIDMASPYRDGGHVLPTTEEECTEIIDGIGLLPSCTIRSGYGMYPWYFFREPLRLHNENDRQRAEALSKAFTHRAQAVARGLGWHLDAKFSLATILRLPGTVNRKGDPRPVTIESMFGVRYRVEEIEAVCQAELDECLGELTRGADVGPFRVNPGAEPPAGKLAALLCNDSRFRLTWEKKRGRDLKDQSQSGYEMALANAAASVEWADQEIVDLLVAHGRDRAGKRPESPSYYKLTVSKARASAAKQIQAAEDKVEVAGRREAETRQAVEAGKAEVLKLVEERLGLRIEGFIQSGSDPAMFYLDLNGHGKVPIGTADDVFFARRIWGAVAEKTSKVLHKPKMEEWEHITRLLFSIVEKHEIADLRRAQETRNWITEYLGEQPRLTDAESQAPEEREAYATAFAQKLPFRKGPKVYLNPAELLKHIRNAELARIEIRDLRLRLSEIGFASKNLSLRTRAGVVGGKYWGGVIGEIECVNQDETQ